jgi:hypothetical protein
MRMNKFPTHLELLTSVSVEISAFRGNTYLYILFPYFLSNRMFPARVRTRPKPGCFPRKRGQLEGGVPESGGRSLSFDRNGMCRRADEQTNRATTRQAQPSRDRPELWYTQTVNQHRKRVSQGLFRNRTRNQIDSDLHFRHSGRSLARFCTVCACVLKQNVG